ncbi:MAG: hypothetical protein ACKKL4_02445 [Patescibacteria group bacterium]
MNIHHSYASKRCRSLFVSGLALVFMLAIFTAGTVHAQSNSSNLLDIINRLLIQIKEAQSNTPLPSSQESSPSENNRSDIPEIDTSTSPGQIGIGAQVRTTDALSVRVFPAQARISVAKAGEGAQVVSGPRTAEGYTWWLLQYENGTKGWSAANWLMLNTIHNNSSGAGGNLTNPRNISQMDGCYSGGYYYSTGARLDTITDRSLNRQTASDGYFICADNGTWEEVATSTQENVLDTTTPTNDQLPTSLPSGCYSKGYYYSSGALATVVIDAKGTRYTNPGGYFVCGSDNKWKKKSFSITDYNDWTAPTTPFNPSNPQTPPSITSSWDTGDILTIDVSVDGNCAIDACVYHYIITLKDGRSIAVNRGALDKHRSVVDGLGNRGFDGNKRTLASLLEKADNGIDIDEDADEEDELEINFELGISFAPINDEEKRAFTKEALDDLNISLLRFAEDWKYSQPREGQFNWSYLDDHINWTEENNIDLLLTIQSNGPDWACSNEKNNQSCVFSNPNDFKVYIETLLARYPNKIEKIQFGNEWQARFWYAGDAQDFVVANNILYEAVQKYSPQTKVVLGGFTSASIRYTSFCNNLVDGFILNSGEYVTKDKRSSICASQEYRNLQDRISYVVDNALYDELDLHLYDDPEQWADYFEMATRMTNKPIIISEFGGPHPVADPKTEEFHALMIHRYIEALNELDIDQAYYYKLIGADTITSSGYDTGLYAYESGGEPHKRLAYDVFKQYGALSAENTENTEDTEGEEEESIEMNVRLGMSFPPVGDKSQMDFTEEALDDLGISLIRFAEHWKFREPSKNDYKWSSLDERIDWAEKNDIDILLTIESNGPDWACSNTRSEVSCVYKDLPAFKRYVENILKRYPNKIEKIQFGNEWQAEYWYAGSAEEFVVANNILYEAVQKYSPQTEVVLGGFTTASLRVISFCRNLVDRFILDTGEYMTKADYNTVCHSQLYRDIVDKIGYVLHNAKYDEADIHLYDDYDQWSAYMDLAESEINVPILVSEFGGPHPVADPQSEEFRVEVLPKYMEAIDALGISEAYYFKLVEGGDITIHDSSLYRLDGNTPVKRPVYDVFKKYSRGALSN